MLLYSDTWDKSDFTAQSPATEVVNSAITLFAVALPIQNPKIQESCLEQLATFLSASSLQRNPLRKAAMTVNIAAALLNTLKVATGETTMSQGTLNSPAVEKMLHELLQVS